MGSRDITKNSCVVVVVVVLNCRELLEATVLSICHIQI